MKTAMVLLNATFSILEWAATVILAPLTFTTVAALVLMTAVVNRKVRLLGKQSGTAQLWARKFQQGA